MVLDLGGLQISVPEFIWTIISFFLFMFLLKKILYTPIISVMDKRKAQINEGLDEGRRAASALEATNSRLAAELSDKGAEARQLVSDARADAEKTKGEMLDAAHKQAEQLHRDVRTRIDAEEQAVRAAVSDDMPELVSILSGRLLGSDIASDDALIRECIGEENGK